MTPITIIKLGGSLLTLKEQAYKLREGIMEQLAPEITECVKLFPDTKFIILNGAGSFGHQTVKNYNLKDGFSDSNSKYGFSKVLQDTAKLNRILVDSLIEKALPAVSFQPSTVFYSDQEGYQFASLELIPMYLKAGFLPCLYGELILDTLTGCKVLSADKIPELLVSYFEQNSEYKITKVINLGSYDGVLDNQNQVIPVINQQNYETIKQYLYQSQNIDVSGGMIKKIDDFLLLADLGMESVIMSGLMKGNLVKYLSGDDVVGTRISI